MSLTREQIEAREQQMLAPYAALSSASQGRAYPLDEHPLRTAFQRDRDRIIHSSAFRRMEYKTQVFIPHERDHFRTRLTHTIEVAQISRTLARVLRLNEDLAEAIALVHDLGHTPFGHSGEDILNDLLSADGGFNHNRQSLRVVDLLEQRYEEHPGLNLTYEVREGIVKHETKVDIKLEEFNPGEKPTLEASLVDLADEITYNAHDIDDGLSAGIITFRQLQSAGIFGRLDLGKAAPKSLLLDDQSRYALVRKLLDMMVTDVANETYRRLAANDVNALDSVRQARHKLAAYSDAIAGIVTALKEFLNDNLYRHSRLVGMSDWAQQIIRKIFSRLREDPKLMPPRFQEMALTEDLQIVIADYIAGMTDRFAIKFYEELS